jgi:hypothetical protein
MILALESESRVTRTGSRSELFAAPQLTDDSTMCGGLSTVHRAGNTPQT